MTQSLNQFAQSVEKGTLDLKLNNNVIQGRVYHSASASLIAGQAVKLIDVAGGVPVVDACGDTDVVFGYVCLMHKETTYPIDSAIEIAMTGSTMYMIAGASIASGARVMHVASSGKVITATGVTKYISGAVLDKATADGDLVRVVTLTWPNINQPAT
jgi:hypothetical protein